MSKDDRKEWSAIARNRRKNTNNRRAIGFCHPCSRAPRGNTGLGLTASAACRKLTMLAIGNPFTQSV
jgi:hypothetical protein